MKSPSVRDVTSLKSKLYTAGYVQTLLHNPEIVKNVF